MKVIGYIRVSTDSQELASQKHLLFTYAQAHQLLIHEFIEVEISSRKNGQARRLDELLAKLAAGDRLLVAELSRLGRNMVETLNLIHTLGARGVQIVFMRQPELSTTGPHTKLLLAIYSYFAEAEREYISLRTKQGLAAARAQGKQLGRPKGTRNKARVLDPYHAQIAHYLTIGLNLAAVLKIVNHQLDKPITYNALKYFVHQDETLRPLWQAHKPPTAA